MRRALDSHHQQGGLDWPEWPSRSTEKAGLGPEHTAVGTGASSGIGRAIATAIASTGAAVCLVGRNTRRLEAVAGKVRASSQSVLVCKSDLTVGSDLEQLASRVRREFRRLDVLVHCAGAFMTGKIEATPVEQLDALYRANLRSPFALTRALLPLLKARSGQIVFINSSQGLAAGAATGPFAATQHARKALADSLRQEVNANGIRVLSVYPGRTATPRMKSLYESEGRSYQPWLLLQPGDVAQAVMTSLQMPRTAELTNIEIRPLIKSY
jgi:NADP-dependent 3-hydroxy acid dehydrogenase YdfG